MTQNPSPLDVAIPQTELARLMPLHLLLGPDGCIQDCGPTLLRVAGPLAGRPFLDTFEVRRPRGIHDSKSLSAALQSTLHLRLLGEKPTLFRAVAAPTPNGPSAFLFNLSFGIHRNVCLGNLHTFFFLST